MKLYLVTWGTNYGLDCCIVEALTENRAIALAFEGKRAWEGAEANEIIPTGNAGVLKIDFYNNYGR